MLYLFLFLLLNSGLLSESSKIYSKRHQGIYSDLVRLEDEGAVAKSCNASTKNGGQLTGKMDAKHKASNIAQKAAQEAKAANDAQLGAAEAAAAQVKTELADKAMQSARAAEAALAGKQQIMEQLQTEHHEAQAVVKEVTESLQNTQVNAAGARDAATEAKNQVNYMKGLVQAVIYNLGQLENVSNAAQQELAEKTQLLEAAKNRVGSLGKQLECAKQDFEKTKQAAYKAACAAVEAREKAQRNPGSTCGA